MGKLTMEEILKQIYRKLLRILPTKPALYLIYFRGYHKILNLKSPRYYGEKIQWLKLYDLAFDEKVPLRPVLKEKL